MKPARLIAIALLLITGCAFNPTATRTISLPSAASPEAVLQAATDAAKDVNFPPVTKLDKANGLVQFGGFGLPQIGVSAQVMVRSGTQVDVTVQHGSVYIKQSPDADADRFKAALETRLQGTK